MTRDESERFISEVQDLCARYGYAISSDEDITIFDLDDMGSGRPYVRVDEFWPGTIYARIVWSEDGEKQIVQFKVGGPE